MKYISTFRPDETFDVEHDGYTPSVETVKKALIAWAAAFIQLPDDEFMAKLEEFGMRSNPTPEEQVIQERLSLEDRKRQTVGVKGVMEVLRVIRLDRMVPPRQPAVAPDFALVNASELEHLLQMFELGANALDAGPIAVTTEQLDERYDVQDLINTLRLPLERWQPGLPTDPVMTIRYDPTFLKE